MGTEIFTPLSNVPLSLGRFSRNSRLLNKLSKNNNTEFHEKRQTVQPLMLHVAQHAQQPLFMKRITRNTEHSCADDDSSYGVSNGGQSSTSRNSLIPLTSKLRSARKEIYSTVQAVTYDQDGTTIHGTLCYSPIEGNELPNHRQQRSTAWRT